MIRYYLLLIFFLQTLFTVGQKGNFQEISISQLLVWNKTTVYDLYSGARASHKTGKAWSNGVNLNYSVGLQKNIYACLGAGYFNQRFGIHRGFNFYEPNVATRLFYTTKYYGYKTLHYFGGLGYRRNFASEYKKTFLKNSEIRLLLLYNVFNTFEQQFLHNFEGIFLDNPNPQIRKSKYHYGSSLTLKGGLVKPVFKKAKIGLDLVFPVYNRWRKDIIFKEDTDEYHHTDLSFGASVNLIYNLN